MDGRAPKLVPRDGDQLEMFSRREMGAQLVPWEGRSPRELTRVRIVLFSSGEAQKSVSDLVSPERPEIGRPTMGPLRYEGAPSLLPLPRRD